MKYIYCPRGMLCYVSSFTLFLSLFFGLTPAMAQESLLIQGRVVSAKDLEVLPGASVQLRGTSQGTTTDDKGSFTFIVTGRKASLRFSYIGYLAMDTTLALPLKNELVITLQQDENMLEGITVSTGYWETTKRLSTGNISKVTAETIAKQPVTNVLQALHGRMPGVFITTENGLPGGNVKVQIRGQNSISAGTLPLYIVDGVPFSSTPLNGLNPDFQNANGFVSPLNSLSPTEIESIEVLKDADATAIYGSRGANGVILIKTKKGRIGKTQFEVTINQAVNQATRIREELSLADYLAIRREAFANDGKEPTAANAPDLMVWDQTMSRDWKKELQARVGKVTIAQASLSGGTNSTNFRLGFNFHGETTLLPNDAGYKRGGTNLDLRHRSNDGRLTTGLTAIYTADNNKHIKTNFLTALGMPPNYPIYNPDGSFNWAINNPEALLREKSSSRTYNLNAHWNLAYFPMDGLSFKSGLGYNRMNMNMFSSSPASSNNPAYSPISTSSFGENTVTTIIAEPQAEYHKKLGKTILTLLAGGTWQDMLTDGLSIKANNFIDESMIGNVEAAALIVTPINKYSHYRYASAFARSALVFSNRYLLSLSIRRDGSSRFGPGKQFGTFGSIGAGWILSEEKWFRQAFSPISYAKLRGSYGVTGNDQIADYQFLSTYRFTGSYQNISTLRPNSIANEIFGWESTHKIEGGIEFKIFQNRLGLEGVVFHHRSGNQLIQYQIPGMSGPFGSYRANFPGVIHNNGVELSIEAKPVTGRKFSWSTSFNVTILRNKLAKFPGIEASTYATSLEIGKDLSLIKGYRFTGINKENGIAEFEDINHNGTITFAQDRVAIGKKSPDLYGGYLNTFLLGPFQLDIFINYVKQQVKFNTTNILTPGNMGNFTPYALNRWRKPGDVTDVQRATAVTGTEAWNARSLLNSSDASIANGSFIRAQNLSLSYALPIAAAKKIGLTGMNFYCRGQNLFMVTFDKRLKGADAENITISDLPPLKTFSFGTKITL